MNRGQVAAYFSLREAPPVFPFLIFFRIAAAVS
jgi:hypothetical protein